MISSVATRPSAPSEASIVRTKSLFAPFASQMITQGDYSEFVDRQVQHLLDDNPNAQAIVFANDDMAFSGYRVYEKRGHKVGKDLYETKNTTRALSVELKMVARSATISVFKV